MNQENRGSFGSKIGAILAAAGSAIGLGNIWRFPAEAGSNGGAAFILIYILFTLFIGIPVLMSEFVIGRRGKGDAYGSFRNLAPRTPWKIIGFISVLSSLLILGYYNLVAGWSVNYIVEAGINDLAGKTPQDYADGFYAFISHPIRPIFFLLVFVALTHFIVAMGVQKGIEKASKIMMPLLFFILIALAVVVLTLPGAGQGVHYLFDVDFSKITGKVLLEALGHAFFALSVGMGCMITYASYFKSDTDIMKTSLSVSLSGVLVAILAGLIIFPAAIPLGIETESGSALVFITLPNVFTQAFAGSPALAYISALAFYILLAMAALTSTISLYEAVVAFVHENLKLSRKVSCWIISAICFLLGVGASMAMGQWNEIKLFGFNFFDVLDKFTANILIPISGLGISLFVGWYMKKKDVLDEISNHGTLKATYFKAFYFLLRYVIPLAIILILLFQLGFFNLFL